MGDSDSETESSGRDDSDTEEEDGRGYGHAYGHGHHATGNEKDLPPPYTPWNIGLQGLIEFDTPDVQGAYFILLSLL